ncbi:MAG: M14 family metallopeptidase [Pseudobdellovibrio sp.]
MTPNNDAKYFPLNYHESRKRFREQIEKLKATQIEEWAIPSKNDKDLFVDSAYWPALKSPKSLLVVTSGIHGSETYAGSAILQMFLQEIMPHLNRDHLGVLLVHAMNPYGFKHHRRTTENGVNLNRNFSISGELYKTRNTASEKIHEKLFPRTKVSSARCAMMDKLQIKNGTAFFDDISMDQFTKATAPGQFVTPQDLEYGGKALEPQSLRLVERLKQLMPLYKDVISLDLHTGLGDQNRLHLLTSGSGKDLHPELFAELFKPESDKEFYEHTPASADGFYEVHGALNCAFADLARADQRVVSITMEFGTLGHSLEAQLRSLNNFVVEHQGFYNGYTSVEIEAEVQKESFERSYPQNDEWREAVIAASRGLFRNVCKRGGFLT